MENFDDVLKDKLEQEFNHYRTIGAMIGWQAFAMVAVDKLDEMKTLDEAKDYFKNEAERVQKELKLKMDNHNEN